MTDPGHRPARRTKLVCTLGPRSAAPNLLELHRAASEAAAPGGLEMREGRLCGGGR